MAKQKTPYADRARALIKARREEYGTPYTHISMKLRAYDVDLAPQLIRRIEDGTRKPSIDEIAGIFAALKLDMHALFADHPTSECHR